VASNNSGSEKVNSDDRKNEDKSDEEIVDDVHDDEDY
jgi:hypothetical protein